VGKPSERIYVIETDPITGEVDRAKVLQLVSDMIGTLFAVGGKVQIAADRVEVGTVMVGEGAVRSRRRRGSWCATRASRRSRATTRRRRRSRRRGDAGDEIEAEVEAAEARRRPTIRPWTSRRPGRGSPTTPISCPTDGDPPSLRRARPPAASAWPTRVQR
jgi:hypothetical protein